MTRKRYGRRALAAALVHGTWTGAIHRERELPRDWATRTGFLVGRTAVIRLGFDPGGAVSPTLAVTAVRN